MMQTQTILKRVELPSKKNGTIKPLNILSLITPRLEVHSMISITPEIAAELLTLNEGNRPLAKGMVDRFASDMKKGYWEFCGNTLKFSDSLKMLDGQHSLHAVVQSGTTQVFNIQTGLTDHSFTVMDNGRLRSAADVMAMKGVSKYSSAVM